jgi:outer membrane protein OmpA-like peptidoglycan-associated protein
VESPAGVLNLERKKQEMSKLQKGLFLKVRGHGGDQKELVAERISFHRSALRVTNQIASGEVELREEMEARLKSHNDSLDAARDRARTEFSSLTARIADLDAYDEKFSGSVRFATGSSMLSAEAKSTLDSLVDIGKGLNGSLVEIAGHADSRGSPEFNRQLSQRRVESVVAYLNSAHAVPLRKIVNPTGIGEANPIGSNNTEEGRALNRRVEIRILVNRGMNAADPMTEANRPKAKTTPEIKPESKPDAMPDASQAPKSDAMPQPNQDAIPDSVPAPKQP